MDAENPGALVGLLRTWAREDEGASPQAAREEGGSLAATHASRDLQDAEDAALEEGADAADFETRWAKIADEDACPWCKEIAGEGEGASYYYFEPENVPRHDNCNCAVGIEGGGVFERGEAIEAVREAQAEAGVLDTPEIVDQIPLDVRGPPAMVEWLNPEGAERVTRRALHHNLDAIKPEIAQLLREVTTTDAELIEHTNANAWYVPADKRIAVRPTLFQEQGSARVMAATHSGWVTPDGAVERGVERTLSHEVGHFLDFQLPGGYRHDLRAGLQNDYGLTMANVGEKVSQYSATNDRELIAELWAEFKTSPNPREPARFAGTFIEEALGPGSPVRRFG